MVEITMSGGRDMTEGSIDFSQVNIDEAGSNLQGLVFTPEQSTNDIQVSSRVNVGYNRAQEDGVNAQINVEYTAMYTYHALWAYFNKDTVALSGFAKYFLDQSAEERDHAHEFMTYQNLRGGQVNLLPIAIPQLTLGQSSNNGFDDALYAMDLHLQLEKFVYKKLIDLHNIADHANDSQMQDMVEDYLTHQIEAIKHAADLVSRIRRVGTPHGVYHIDMELQHAPA